MVTKQKIIKTDIDIKDIVGEVIEKIRHETCSDILRDEHKKIETLKAKIKKNLENAHEKDVKREVYTIARDIWEKRRKELGEREPLNQTIRDLFQNELDSINNKIARVRGASPGITEKQKEEYSKQLNEIYEFIEKFTEEISSKYGYGLSKEKEP